MHHYGGLPLFGAVLSLLGMAGLLSLVWGVTAALTRLVSPALAVWLLPAAWTALEALRQFPPYVFPWNPTAAACAAWPPALASLPVWGATGLGWAMVAVGAGGWGLARRATRRSGAAAVAAALALVVAFSALAPAPQLRGEPIDVALLQPGTGLEERWNPANWQEIVARVWRLTHEAAAEGAELVLWPEGAVPFHVEGDVEARRQVTALAADLDLKIVLTSFGSTADGGYTNSAFLLDGNGLAPVRYDKVRLVPFGEYVPPIFRFAFTESLVREVASFTPGDAPRLLPAQVPLGVAICYEVVFADLLARQVRLGAEILTTVTNDGWYGFSWAPQQHFAQAVLRAVETRRWLARAALSGISGFVAPDGRVTQRLEVGDSGLLLAEVQPMSGMTPRARWGEWWGAACGLATLALLVAARFRRVTARKR